MNLSIPARSAKSLKKPVLKTRAKTSITTEIDAMRTKKIFVLLAETFQALGDSSRIQIVWALSKGELCVGDVANLLEISQPAVSHHFRTLRNLKLVKSRREGRTIFYALDDEHIENLLHEGIKHVQDFV